MPRPVVLDAQPGSALAVGNAGDRVKSVTAVHRRLLPLDAGLSVGSCPRGLATV